MPARRKSTGTRARSRKRSRLPRWWPGAQVRRRWFKAFRRAPRGAQWTLGTLAVIALALAVNWTYQVIRKPSELFFPVSSVLYKTPAETWREYGSLFEKHATAVITPEFLAALAQVEGSGNPLVRTYWRWSLSREPFEIYRPASSAVGMYQITDGTFAEAQRYCVHDHAVVEDGPWHAWRSCWFNSAYSRVVPSHAIEMTSAYLDVRVAQAIARAGPRQATARQKRELAAVIHLCGARAGDGYARRGFAFLPRQRCGDHDARAYVARVEAMERAFAQVGEKD